MADTVRAHWSLASVLCAMACACSGEAPGTQTPASTGAAPGDTSTTTNSSSASTTLGTTAAGVTTGAGPTGSSMGGASGSLSSNSSGSSASTTGTPATATTGDVGMGSVGGAAATGSTTTPSVTTGSGGNTTGTTGTTGSTIPDDGDRSPQAVCARWNADRSNMNEGTWSGSIQSCDAGDISAEGRDNALKLFNLYRWLADLPAVETSEDRNQQAQACALMMDANNSLSHDPPENWTCYTELGAQGAATSNISGGPGVMSVDLYMLDVGNESTMGHRRIILSNWLGPIGLGSTGQGGSSCMQNIGGNGDAGKPWVAWPPAGAFPIQAYAPGRSTYSETGWSIQSESIELSGADVTVTAGGQSLGVNVSNLTGNYGSTDGLRIEPSGWDVEAGQTYAVNVTGIDTPISYELHIVDCGD